MSGKRITVAMLRGLTPQPCSAEVAKFDQLFPRGAPLTLGNICKALRAGLDVEWLVVDDAAYDAARAPALLEALKRRFFEQATIDRGVDPTEGMNVDAIPD